MFTGPGQPPRSRVVFGGVYDSNCAVHGLCGPSLCWLAGDHHLVLPAGGDGGSLCPGGEAPVSALATLGDFTFLAGEPREELVRFLPPSRRPDYHILVPQNEGWARCIAGVYPQARRVTRYATEKTGMLFDRTRLARLAARLSPSDQLCPVNTTLYQRCLASPWSRDLVAQFPTPAVFARRGLGMAVLRRGDWWPGLPPIPGIGGASRWRWTPTLPAGARDWPRLPQRRSSWPAWTGALPQLGCPHQAVPGPGGKIRLPIQPCLSGL